MHMRIVSRDVTNVPVLVPVDPCSGGGYVITTGQAYVGGNPYAYVYGDLEPGRKLRPVQLVQAARYAANMGGEEEV
jgi:hypothetical protein